MQNQQLNIKSKSTYFLTPIWCVLVSTVFLLSENKQHFLNETIENEEVPSTEVIQTNQGVSTNKKLVPLVENLNHFFIEKECISVLCFKNLKLFLINCQLRLYH